VTIVLVLNIIILELVMVDTTLRKVSALNARKNGEREKGVN
jgi:hypothetical protein